MQDGDNEPNNPGNINNYDAENNKFNKESRVRKHDVHAL